MSTTFNRRQALVGTAAAAIGAASLVGPAAALGEQRSLAADPETVRLAQIWHEAYRQAKAAALLTECSAVHPLADETDKSFRALLAVGREYSAARRAILTAKPHGVDGAAAMLSCAVAIFNDRRRARAGADGIPSMVFEWQGELEMADLAMEALQEVACLP